MTVNASVPRQPPVMLRIAAYLAGLEGVLFVGYGVLELVNLSSERLSMGLTTSLFFLAYGAALLLCAVGLVNGRSWARSPVVFAQLLQICVAWSFFGGETTVVAAVLLVVSVIVAGGILNPRSLAYLSDEEPHQV